MKFRFKIQSYQTEAVQAVVDCFQGQPMQSGLRYRIDPGMVKAGQTQMLEMDEGLRNEDLVLPPENVLKNIQSVQGRQNLPISTELKRTSVADVNLDVEMETGTGKTYCYIKTIFELNQRYGWNKFIIVVPSIAIREGVAQSLSDTTDHFLEQYGKRVRWFIYNSRELHELESFSSDAGINVMIINVQAFNARGNDARRIYEELDDFRSRRPIDVIKKNHPILILDEPQKMEGTRTVERMKEFNPLFILRYSATHRQEHNKIYRLDALDAYNQKLVKKIAVRGISLKGQAGTSAYLYLQNIVISRNKPPVARVEMEIGYTGTIKKEIRNLEKGDNLFAKSGELAQYKGYVVSDISAIDNTVSFTNGVTLEAGDAQGDVNEAVLRRLQIREAIAAHFEKEGQLFERGIKVLSLFFIDHVAKYRQYEGGTEKAGEYAAVFEDEYTRHLNEVLTLEDTAYNRYLKGIAPDRTHEGYFSIDKNKRLVDPATGARSTESDDVDAYDLILKRKAQLLSFNEPVRFIFAHSALREGWDNPNVFVIGMLKHSDNSVSRRQEVGRGLRISVNQNGDRMDDPATVHDLNLLTVVASEGYKEFVAGLQTEIVKELSGRPRKADEAYFAGKILRTTVGDVQVTPQMAKLLTRYLIKNDYTDTDDKITSAYHEASKAETLAPLPAELAPYTTQVFQLVDTVFSDSAAIEIANDRNKQKYLLNDNFAKKEFKELWERIHQKAVYVVDFDSNQLVEKCVVALDQELKVAPLQYVVQRGAQTNGTTYEALQSGKAFAVPETQTSQLNASVNSSVPYDLIGKISGETRLTRTTVGRILTRIKPSVFAKYQANPEDFLRNAARLINEQKAAVVVEHLTYNEINERYDADIFTREQGQKAPDAAALRLLAPAAQPQGHSLPSKSFDWPLLETRYRMARSIPPPAPRAHLDFLHPARNLWRLRLGSVKLSQLERHVLGWDRGADIASDLIPRIYLDFVRGGRAEPLVPVFQHNQMDLCGLAGLSGRILSLLGDGEGTSQDGLELFGVSRICERRGEPKRARRLYERSIASVLPEETDRVARAALARLAKRDGDFTCAHELWESVLGNSREGYEAYEQLAIDYEHEAREPGRALALAREALAQLRRANQAGTIAATEYRRTKERFEHRILRLERKAGRTLLDALDA